MSYHLNKFVWFLLNPAMLFLIGIALGAILLGRRRLRAGLTVLALVALGFWFLSSLAAVALLGLPLERPYLANEAVETLPEAEAIVLLGGGIGKAEGLVYPDMFSAADRVWHAARLFKAGKAPRIVASGCGEGESAVPLLVDLGVPREAIEVDGDSRNTYENSRFTERLLGAGKKVLLVTSAWHMPRARGNFSKTSLEVVPAACDFSAHHAVRSARGWRDFLVPSTGNFELTGYFVKEWLGRLARK